MTRLALILDTETTGLDPSKDQCIEVAVTLYDLLHAAPLSSYSSLIRCDRNPAYDINRIALGMLGQAPPAPEVWSAVESYAARADVILAHRAEFDRGFVPAAIRDMRPWVCTKFHVEWPCGKPGDSLVSMALAHGVGVVTAHRAMTDVDILARILTRAEQILSEEGSLQQMVAHAMRPRRKVIALVSYDDREKAKSAGFAWEPGPRQWVADMFEDKLAGLPFKVRDAST